MALPPPRSRQWLLIRPKTPLTQSLPGYTELVDFSNAETVQTATGTPLAPGANGPFAYICAPMYNGTAATKYSQITDGDIFACTLPATGNASYPFYSLSAPGSGVAHLYLSAVPNASYLTFKHRTSDR